MIQTQTNPRDAYAFLMSRGLYVAAAHLASEHQLGAELIAEAGDAATERYADPRYDGLFSLVEESLNVIGGLAMDALAHEPAHA
jgi:hypothetical protein